MKTTIVYAHPWHGSYNKAILDTAKQQLDKSGKPYHIIDLHKDNFDPVLSESDLALFSKGQTTDELVLKYQKILEKTDELIFIFPIWWYGMPAILKGFIDKTMLKNFAYKEGKTGLKGMLGQIKKTMIITTSEAPTWYLRFVAGNPIAGTMIKTIFKGIGLRNIKWFNNGYTKSGTAKTRSRFLTKVEKHV